MEDIIGKMAARMVVGKPTRHQRWLLAVLPLAFLAALLIVALGLLQFNLRIPEPHSAPLAIDVALIFPMLMFGVIGSLIIAYHPRNAIGWLFYIVGCSGVFSGFGTQYVFYGLYARPELLREGVLLILLSNTAWLLFLVPILTLLPLLFPTGRPLSPRWGWLVWITIGGMALLWLGEMLRPSVTVSEGLVLENPYGMAAVAPWVEWGNTAGLFVLMLVALLSVVSLVIRYRHGGGQARAQIRWFALGATLNLVALLASELLGVDNELVFALLFSVMPIAVALAIFKYRLYDIDLLIRRTLVYSTLTALLALVYFSSVVLLQFLFTRRTGEESTVAIVVSTLLIAALFTPLRRRVQRVIDRRFFRHKYDAQQVLAQFATTAREEADVDRLTANVIRILEDTMHPTKITVWLRSVKKN
jgi:hypothetical protein